MIPEAPTSPTASYGPLLQMAYMSTAVTRPSLVKRRSGIKKASFQPTVPTLMLWLFHRLAGFFGVGEIGRRAFLLPLQVRWRARQFIFGFRCRRGWFNPHFSFDARVGTAWTQG